MGQNLSIFLSYLLRHNPGELGLDMDTHGWVPVQQLIDRINGAGRCRLTRELLEDLVARDSKGRYRISPDGTRIKACQGHSLEWVEPELAWGDPPAVLYHGTTARAWEQIRIQGIRKMRRHAVHMQADPEKAWQSARRWHETPVVLKIDAARMAADGHRFGVSDNGVWCTEQVPAEYILSPMYTPAP